MKLFYIIFGVFAMLLTPLWVYGMFFNINDKLESFFFFSWMTCCFIIVIAMMINALIEELEEI